MKLNPKKTKSMVVSRSRTYVRGYGDLTLRGLELEEVKSLHILRVTFGSKLTFESHWGEVVSKAAQSPAIVSRAGKLFDCSCVLKSCFNANVLIKLGYCAPVWLSSAESHLGLLDSIVRCAESYVRVIFVV